MTKTMTGRAKILRHKTGTIGPVGAAFAQLLCIQQALLQRPVSVYPGERGDAGLSARCEVHHAH